MEEMQRKAYRRKLFNDQANKLLRRYPDVRDEVMWRMAHLNSKWDTLEQTITPRKSNPDQLDLCTGNKETFNAYSCAGRAVMIP
jgi:hypothetical protein